MVLSENHKRCRCRLYLQRETRLEQCPLPVLGWMPPCTGSPQQFRKKKKQKPWVCNTKDMCPRHYLMWASKTELKAELQWVPDQWKEVLTNDITAWVINVSLPSPYIATSVCMPLISAARTEETSDAKCVENFQRSISIWKRAENIIWISSPFKNSIPAGKKVIICI